MTRIIAFVNQKGGVAKTTSAVNVGAGLSLAGKRVLMIDIDPQGHLSNSLGIDTIDLDNTIHEMLIGESDIKDAIVTTSAFYDVLPSDIRLSGAELQIGFKQGREAILKEALQSIINKYDYILIDCPPSLTLLTLNALTAAKEVFIPLQTEYLALHGMSQLLQTVKVVKERLNPELEITGIIATLYDRRKSLNRDVVKKIKDYFPNKLFKTHIRNNVALAEAQGFGIDIFHYQRRSNGAKDYGSLVSEIIKQEKES